MTLTKEIKTGTLDPPSRLSCRAGYGAVGTHYLVSSSSGDLALRNASKSFQRVGNQFLNGPSRCATYLPWTEIPI